MKSSSISSVTTHHNDILPGAGNNRHTGNKLYARLVDANKEAFVLADARGKDRIVLKVYNKVEGRFLKKGKDELYYISDKDAALKKIKKALSENNKVMIENLMKTGKMKSRHPQRKKLSSKNCIRNPRKQSKVAVSTFSNEPTKNDWDQMAKTLKSLSDKDFLTRTLKLPCEDKPPIRISRLEQNDFMPDAQYYSHPGNKIFVSLIKVHKKDYVLATDKAEREDIANRVYDSIQHQTPPGRFLKIAREGYLSVGDKSYGLRVVRRALGENEGVILQYLDMENRKGPLKRFESPEKNKKIAPQENSKQTLEKENRGDFLRCLSKHLSGLHLNDK